MTLQCDVRKHGLHLLRVIEVESFLFLQCQRYIFGNLDIFNFLQTIIIIIKHAVTCRHDTCMITQLAGATYGLLQGRYLRTY